jgi:hypothetical protein
LRSNNKVVAVLAAILCGQLFAGALCSAKSLLLDGDEPLLTAPVTYFEDELVRLRKRLNIPKPPHTPVQAHNSTDNLTRETDLIDLRTALKKRGDKTNEVERLVTGYREIRDALAAHDTAMERWRYLMAGWNADTNAPRPELPSFSVPEGLPGEFADYVSGAIALRSGNTNAARLAWEALLERPVEERKFKSTWAAFMLAKSYESDQPSKAIGYFNQTRAMAQEGFSDSLGLAASTIGWQARLHLHANEFDRAIDLYLLQFAMDDDTACESLRTTSRKALKAPSIALERLAKNANARAVITAHVTSMEPSNWPLDENETPISPALAWLKAVERVGVTNFDSAEQLALATYQAGQFEVAQRWIKLSASSPVSQWLQAKLRLRAGKVDQAANILSKLTRAFPMNDPTNVQHNALHENFYVPSGSYRHLTMGKHVLGELGALRLHRREYTSALDALLNADFWFDAAYVGERVLKIDELKSYVERNWPHQGEDNSRELSADENERITHCKNIRWLLAQRLTRAGRTTEAIAYVPESEFKNFATLVSHLAIAQDEARSKAERATNYFQAACVLCKHGMELIGTQVEPDFTARDGRYDQTPVVAQRTTNATNSVVTASADELHRARAHTPDPNERFHYLYQAAALALEAAKLMPNDSDETAHVLYTAGCWIKAEDPKTADVFYKLLVRRCRKTELGKAADEWRWFPRLDENGKPLPSQRLVKIPPANDTVTELPPPP